MRDQKPRLRLTFACSAIAATLALSGSAEALIKKPLLMNYCDCSCKGEWSATQVVLVHKLFFSSSSCGSFEGSDCAVRASDGLPVRGTWEDCVHQGKYWVVLMRRAKGLTARRALIHP